VPESGWRYWDVFDMNRSDPNCLPAMRQATDMLPGFDKPTGTRNPLDALHEFRDAVIAWFDQTGRIYPWRATTDPYAILVSELMLQQTRIETVLDRRYFERWMERFQMSPCWQLRRTTKFSKPGRDWAMYRRARNLREAARRIVAKHGGVFPGRSPGDSCFAWVGDYTVGAVLAFAYDQAFAMIDGNVARVLTRLFDYRERIDKPAGRRRLAEWSSPCLPIRCGLAGSNLDSWRSANGFCRPRQPLCGQCPVADFCSTRDPDSLPVKRSAGIEEVDEFVGYLSDPSRGIFLCREEGGRRVGLWRLPLLWDEGRADLELLLQFSYPITRYRVNLYVYAVPAWLEIPAAGKWFPRRNWIHWPSHHPIGAPWTNCGSLSVDNRNAAKLMDFGSSRRVRSSSQSEEFWIGPRQEELVEEELPPW